ncbi:uncharacterized protein LOC131299678 [Rhododendron vialii]|uniref:uncharacterized protein LOC131299678 n=1 Tax=Rhododendron vialii TaxID=182163 RepID=UPI002660434A|nr:uncharacterized protein LOC131299678 [Rhododendron vialii]
MVRPSASNGHKFIPVVIDYFTKWVEAESYKTLTTVQVAQFIRKNINYRYSLPQAFVSNNGTHFKGKVLELFEEFKIQIHHSIVYRPQTNGLVEAANKNVDVTPHPGKHHSKLFSKWDGPTPWPCSNSK